MKVTAPYKKGNWCIKITEDSGFVHEIEFESDSEAWKAFDRINGIDDEDEDD